MFRLLQRTDTLQGSDRPFIAFRPEHVAYSSVFCGLAGVTAANRVNFYVDEDNRAVGFRFLKDKGNEANSFSLRIQGRHKRSFFSTIGELKNLPWVRAVCHLDKQQRRFEPTWEKTENGSLWVVHLCPAFEKKAARESEKIAKGSGIYRYRRAGEIVYVGRGNIADRLQDQTRKEWDFDLVEYSLLNNPDEQAKWEYYWIERYRNENDGKLPLYNKISGSKT